MRVLWTIVATLSGLASAQAFTCDDVRALSQEQRAITSRPTTLRRPNRMLFVGSVLGRKRTIQPSLWRKNRRVASRATNETSVSSDDRAGW
jgi:hypothetical protein